MPSFLTRLKDYSLDLLFPRWCVGCGREGDLLCPACLVSLPRISPPVCPRCGIPQPGGNPCPACAGSTPGGLDGLRSPFRFEGAVRKAVHQMKYSNLRLLAGPLAQLLHQYMESSPLPAEVLVPVPLHPRRLRERGYNQSGLLARELGALRGLPVDEGCLFRQHFTPPQARTAALAERKANVRGAFACRDGRLRDKRVLLIDDVATSGATLGACAAALKDGGAASVWGLTLAREL